MNNWTRAQLKERAKNTLRVNYWIAFVVAIILSIALGGGSGGGGNSSFRTSTDYNSETISSFESSFDISEPIEIVKDFFSSYGAIRTSAFIGVVIMLSLFAIAVQVFLMNQLVVGCQKFFVTSAESPHKNMRPLGIGFKQGNYWPIVKAMFLRSLYTFLWTLLFIIPGIIKSYSYRMVPFILTDNPQMDAANAITLSRQMMDGEKWKTFVLDLSFIGWYLLGMLACCIGILFVSPYAYSTQAQLYLVLRDKAINKNLCTPGQLNLSANA